MKPKRIPAIRSRLFLLVIACIFPALLMVAALIAYNYQQSRGQLIRESIATARAMMSAVDRDLAGLQAALLALSTSPHLESDDIRAFYDQAQQVVKAQKAGNIVLADLTFQQRLNTFRPFGSKLPSEESNPWLRRVVETGRPVTSDIFLGPVTGKPLITISVPVYRGDKLIYVLGAAMLPERLSDLLAQQRLAPDRIAAVFDSTGTIVARTHRMEELVGKKGNAELVERMAQVPEDALENITLDGMRVLAVFSRSTVSRWTLAIGIPLDNLSRELAQGLWWLVAGSAVLLLSSLALAGTIAGRIARSIHQLAAPALALGSGEAVTVPSLPLKEADEVGKALTRASAMLKAAQHRANHDTLTGLANRALFDEILDQQLTICARTQTNLALIYLDLDGFKPVNDSHGHAAGDEMLRLVAGRLKGATRESDLAARVGGDEFALVLMHTGLEAAKGVAAKLIESLSMPYPVGALSLEISVSIGIAVYPQSGTSSTVLAQRADEAMYKAKAAGKRRFVVAA